ncbi:AraC family transcriptional regulator [Streptomyces sp. NPDC050418]|uniref:AraC family transcriptional regulator n=1 Tax=Streptomyces sp. NPDC050418 TaxID=3365612 RepID=UPI0037A8E365
MDALAGLLEGPRAKGAFLIRACFDPPWSVRIEDEAPVSVMVMLRGEGWLIPDDGEKLHMGTGDIAIARGPAPYVCADDPATEPRAVILPGGLCAAPDGREMKDYLDLGTRTWGGRTDGEAVMLVGTYQPAGEMSSRLLDALPPQLVLREEVADCHLLPLLEEEILRDEPGQDVVLDRLLDLLLITSLRAWFARPDASPPAWYKALGDPVVGAALRLIQDDPAHPWTVAELATKAGVSRAALARRFTELVGDPPMAYLTAWRLALAADLVRDTDLTLSSIARKVGYGSPFALSTAFKRAYGVSPVELREG